MRLRAAALVALLAAAPAAAGELDARVDVGLAHRSDDFQFNIAGPEPYTGAHVNVLSELTWTDLSIEELSVAAELSRADSFLLELVWKGGRISAGDNQDSDYFRNNRTAEFRRSNNKADAGRTADVRLGAGLPFSLGGAALTPMAGWAYASQRLFMMEGRQTVCVDYDAFGAPTPCATGFIPRLNSNYRHRWQGAWMGLRADAQAGPVQLRGEARYFSTLDFLAHADWNLRPDFAHPKSFEHEADGKGWEVDASVAYDFSPEAGVGAGFSWRRWCAANGVDRVFGSDGSSGVTPLNEAVWDSFAFRLTVSFRALRPGEEDDIPGF